MFSYGPLHVAEQKQGDQLDPTYSSYVRIRDVALGTCQKRWTIRGSGERWLGISILVASQDDDDDDIDWSSNYTFLKLYYFYICLYFHVQVSMNLVLMIKKKKELWIKLIRLLM